MVIAPHQNKTMADARLAVWAITPNGKRLGTILCDHVKQARLFISSRMAGDSPEAITSGTAPGKVHAGVDPDETTQKIQIFHRLSDAVAKQFYAYDCHVFIFSTGIAVRILAPLLVSKLTDPAVVVLDDQGLHTISLVSGHIGQANQYTRQIAHLLGSDPVITTATDVNHLPSIDLLAEECNLFIETPWTIKTINMAFLENKKIRLHDPLNLISPCISNDWIDNTAENLPRVICDWRRKKVSRETLVLRPRVLAVGIGCNRNTPFKTILEFFTTTLASAGISMYCTAVLATSDIKKNEPGILALAEHLNLPVRFYDTHQLSSVKTIQTPSSMVEKHIGVKSVCEAAAILAAGNGPLILPKQKNPDVTLAVALQKTDSLWWAPDPAI
ncbi:MAG: cobalamin biosynthesis protein [Desulfotignum sp.]|nr:cobalamin biosynthesis protein [Desulfotignum sp.]